VALVTIRPARRAESERLREILGRSKGHWGYDPAVLASWVASYDFDELFDSHELLAAEVDGAVVAWASVIVRDEGVAVLDDLWVEPGSIGRGLGSQLFEAARARAAALGASELEWEAEPNALGFYERMGGRHVRDSTSEWGRRLQVMAVRIS
jgi:GNAT superfamily N-acetyltransferase